MDVVNLKAMINHSFLEKIKLSGRVGLDLGNLSQIVVRENKRK